MIMNAETIEALVLGGAFLGGGGGGSLEEGRRLGLESLRLGQPVLLPVDDLRPADIVVTVSAVGAPAAREKLVLPDDYIRAVRLLAERIDGRVSGLISSENGGISSVNGLIQSAALGIPVIDCPCNGRAHPTGTMGGMALGERPGFVSRQVAVGGNPSAGRRLEMYVEAPLPLADALVREAAVRAGGLVAVARNPVEAAYVRDHGAPGAIRMALELGRIILGRRHAGGEEVARTLAEALGGAVAGSGRVSNIRLETTGGYDFGSLRVDDLCLRFWNEYMELERKGARLATFPDLIATLAAEDGTPRTSADLEPGAEVVVLHAPGQRLILGSGMRVAANLRAVEEAMRMLKGAGAGNKGGGNGT